MIAQLFAVESMAVASVVREQSKVQVVVFGVSRAFSVLQALFSLSPDRGCISGASGWVGVVWCGRIAHVHLLLPLLPDQLLSWLATRPPCRPLRLCLGRRWLIRASFMAARVQMGQPAQREIGATDEQRHQVDSDRRTIGWRRPSDSD